jgi:hypothetical protein
MKSLSTISFWLGLLSIPAALIVFFAKSHDLGIFIGLWPATLLILSYILEKKAG